MNTTTPSSAFDMPPTMRRRHLRAAVMGNVLEWYDFIIYAFLAKTIASKFFPGEDETAGLLATFATFGVGFLARPLGAAIIGRIGDTRGRKTALITTIFGMAAGTVGIGLLPTYDSVGVWAPVLLVAMRLIQGLAAGGEWGGATAFIVESAPGHRRGFYGSIGQASIAASNLLASLVVASVGALLASEIMADWGWRVPFLLGGVLFALGLWMRSNIEETPAFRQAQAAAAENSATTRRNNNSDGDNHAAFIMMAKAFGFTIVWTVAYYVMLSYIVTFLQVHAGLTAQEALWANSAALVVLVLTTPLFGLLSDRIGRKPLLLACCVAFVILPYPVFSLMLAKPSIYVVMAAMMLVNLFIAAFSGAGPAALSELFPTHRRTLLMSVGYSVSVAIFGGFAPYISTWLIKVTDSPISPSYYLMAAGLVSGLVIAKRRTANWPEEPAMTNQRILIWGAGAIGGTVGAFLVRAGHDVTFVDVVAEHVAAIRDSARGLAITGPVDSFTITAPAYTPDALVGQWPRIFLAVKAQDTEVACRALLPHLPQDGYVLSLQNGLCEPVIAGVVGAERTVGAFVNFGADWMAPGEVHFGNRAAVALGELDGSFTPRLQALHQDMCAFEPDAIVTDDIHSYLWGKLAYGALLFAQAAGQLGIADCLARPELLPLWQALAGEIMDVARACGIKPRGFNGFDPDAFGQGRSLKAAADSVAAMVAFNRPNAKTHSGIWRDIAVRKRRTEVDAQLVPILTMAAEHELACPTLQALVDMIHLIEQGKNPQADDNLLELLP